MPINNQNPYTQGYKADKADQQRFKATSDPRKYPDPEQPNETPVEPLGVPPNTPPSKDIPPQSRYADQPQGTPGTRVQDTKNNEEFSASQRSKQNVEASRNKQRKV